jgi:hypothetical protein
MSMMDELEGKPAPDLAEPLERLRRHIRWLQVIVAVGFVAIAGALYWQGHVVANSVADAQRPFVAFKDGQFLPVTGNGQPAWQFVGLWDNDGNTNALDLQVQISLWTGAGLQPGFTKKDASSNPIGGLTLGPRTTLTVPDFTLPAEALAAAKHAPGYLAIWGVARYREEAPGRPAHVTRFCNYVTWVDGDPMHDLRLAVRYNACREGNCTDAACVAEGYAP